MQFFHVIILTILINLPFGYLRGSRKKYSILWFLYIHLPVPFVMFIRKIFEVEFDWVFGPFYIIAYILGQWLGQKLYHQRKKQKAF